MPDGIMQRLAQGPVLGDGGYLLELERRGFVQAGPFTPEVVLDHPEAVAGLHGEFIRAGVDVIQTMTFYATEDKLATVGLSGQVAAVNRRAVGIARDAAAAADRNVLIGRQPEPHLGVPIRRRGCGRPGAAAVRHPDRTSSSTPAGWTSGSGRPFPTWARRCCSWSAPLSPGSR
ncbi:MAG: homocysteine S-methyltransferase family protein [Acidimicrobiia bacterium]|nr:homocysteine S-methyltransferase family protein [Acidimicrobiia bacterium]